MVLTRAQEDDILRHLFDCMQEPSDGTSMIDRVLRKDGIFTLSDIVNLTDADVDTFCELDSNDDVTTTQLSFGRRLRFKRLRGFIAINDLG